MEIRAEQPEDVPVIHSLLTAAFPGDDEANLVMALRAAGRLSLSLVAIEGNRVMGHVAFSPVTVGDVPGGLGLAPLAIHPDFQNRGVGGWLVCEGVERIAAMGVGYVVVLGYPEYYSKHGFRRASELGIGNEFGADDAFMVMELRPEGIPAGGGTARYGPEFGAWS